MTLYHLLMRGQETKTETAAKRNSISEVSKRVYKNRLVRVLKNKGLSGRVGVPVLTEKFPTLRASKIQHRTQGSLHGENKHATNTLRAISWHIYLYRNCCFCSIDTGTPQAVTTTECTPDLRSQTCSHAKYYYHSSRCHQLKGIVCHETPDSQG